MADPRIALCAIVRNEIRGLVEWLAHYKALGVTDFLIYDNDSDDGTSDLLRALDEAGEVVHLDWPHAVGRRPQRLAYAHAKKHAKADWIAFFDADEFLILHEDRDIGSFLSRFGADVSAVAVNWVVFGSGGERCYRPAPVMERFTDALPPDARESHTVKAMARVGRIGRAGIHRVAVREGRYVTPSGREAVFTGLTASDRPDTAVAALHHYAVKSLEEFAEKRARGHANSQDAARKRMRLDEGFAEFDAGGVQNRDALTRTPAMRVEAERLCRILRAAGVEFPVWPFV